MNDNVITYEQPLNELIRVCLRLEQLFGQIDHQILDSSAPGTRNIIIIIINLLHLVDRPDLKAKLAKELSNQMMLLNRLENSPDINQNKLNELLVQLNELSRNFIDSSRKIGHNLREVELLNTLRLHLASPGGGCSFDVPLYHFWLQQPAESRLALIKSWISEFYSVRLATDLILQLAREGSNIQQKTATKGFYQDMLDPQSKLRLVRVILPADAATYPEVSVGRHFLGIRFYSPNIHERPVQYPQSIEFGLAYCM